MPEGRSYRRTSKPKRSRRRLLKGYELQNIVYSLGMPLAALFAGITLLFFWGAISAGTGPVRQVLLLVSLPFGLLAAVLVIRAVLAKRFLSAYHSIHELRRMDPVQFEHYVASLFRKQGFTARVTVASGDDGVDIVVKKNGERSVVQCKRYSESHHVGSEEMQRFIGSMQIYKVQRGFFVATTGFTPRAISLAKEHRVTIIDDILLAKAVYKAFGNTATTPA